MEIIIQLISGMVGGNLAEAMDFPYSPVRLVVLMLPADAATRNQVTVRRGPTESESRPAGNCMAA